jgi:hypothetical protein
MPCDTFHREDSIVFISFVSPMTNVTKAHSYVSETFHVMSQIFNYELTFSAYKLHCERHKKLIFSVP